MPKYLRSWRCALSRRQPMKKGLAVTEIIVVVAILVILFAFTVPKFMTLVHKSQEGSTKHHLMRVRSAIAAYYGENQGTYPTDDLSCLVPQKFPKPAFRGIRRPHTFPRVILRQLSPKPAVGLTSMIRPIRAMVIFL